MWTCRRLTPSSLHKALKLFVKQEINAFLEKNPDLAEAIQTNPGLYELALSRLERAFADLNAHEAALALAQSSLQYHDGFTFITVDYGDHGQGTGQSTTFRVPNPDLSRDEPASGRAFFRASLVRSISRLSETVLRLRNEVPEAEEDIVLIASSRQEGLNFVAEKQERLKQGTPSAGERDDPMIQVCSFLSFRIQPLPFVG